MKDKVIIQIKKNKTGTSDCDLVEVLLRCFPIPLACYVMSTCLASGIYTGPRPVTATH